ncbi:hypothetical protein CIG75_17290 [Tumebacillus algifaecis]|uniref:YcaO domain-containing protein n=1 Tax=Tumebacillus algifaecis TaxID=1214604 RepID=A0A223D4P4_9BACL|nr:TOMM precursor leader peptide-binding protein [Tumebacillus algifaecis]ASS76541.1 hypothetical protein CIG75_17290 [Tumebacillus algifaecis]
MTGGLSRPAFSGNYRVLTAGADTLMLMSEAGDILLQGRAYSALAPLIDGQRSSDQLVRMVRDLVPPAEAYYALLQLAQQGFLTEGGDTLPAEQAAFWHALGVDSRTDREALLPRKVAVTALDPLDRNTFLDKLHHHAIEVADPSEQSAFDIVLTDHYLREELLAFNEQAWAMNRAWLPAKPIGSTIWIGPFIRPSHTACFACLAHRLHAKQFARERIAAHQNWSNRDHIPQATTQASLQTALELLALETGKLLRHDRYPTLHHTLISIDLLTLQTQTHTVVRRPQCPICGDGSSRSTPPAPPDLQSRQKLSASDGSSRTVTAEATWQTYAHHVSPITGIIKQLAVADPDPVHPAIHNYTADANVVFTQSHDLDTLKQHLRSRSAGKGTSALQAKVGALCESLERYSGLYQGDEFSIRSSYHQLADRAIHPHHYLLFSERQYDQRDKINSARLSMFEWIPHRFDEHSVVDWTPLWSLTEQRVKYLPTACCYYSYPQQAERAFALADSNGCASGNTLEEAILHGFFELVERDAVAIWWYNRLRREQVDLNSFGHPYIAQLRDAYRSHYQREFWVLNLTHDLQIPTFAAISRQLGRPAEHLILGFGAHFDPEIALLRALTEMNQSLPLLRQGISANVHRQIANWWRTASLENQPYLAPDATRPAVRASDFRNVWQDDLLDDLRLAQQIVEQKGMEMLVLDQTRPDVGLPVAKVIVPGLRHFWTRFAPGRLYDLPAQQNWLAQPHAETELNPIPMFL